MEIVVLSVLVFVQSRVCEDEGAGEVSNGKYQLLMSSQSLFTFST